MDTSNVPRSVCFLHKESKVGEEMDLEQHARATAEPSLPYGMLSVMRRTISSRRNTLCIAVEKTELWDDKSPLLDLGLGAQYSMVAVTVATLL